MPHRLYTWTWEKINSCVTHTLAKFIIYKLSQLHTCIHTAIRNQDAGSLSHDCNASECKLWGSSASSPLELSLSSSSVGSFASATELEPECLLLCCSSFCTDPRMIWLWTYTLNGNKPSSRHIKAKHACHADLNRQEYVMLSVSRCW